MPTSPVATSTADDDEEGPIPHAGLSRFKAVENCNYTIELAKANKMHMVGVQGADIVDGRKTLVLGLIWQLMRFASFSMRTQLKLIIFYLFKNEHHSNTGFPDIKRKTSYGPRYAEMGEHYCKGGSP